MKTAYLTIILNIFSFSTGYLNTQPVEREYYYYYANTEQFIQPIDSAIAGAQQLLFEILNDSLSYKPKIYISDNIADFRKLIGSAFPDWGAAAALPYREMIALKSPAHFSLGKSLPELVKHEYAHLALHDKLRLTDPPRWIDEGLAMYIAYEWGWSANFAMSKAVVFKSLVPLEDIEKLNRFYEGKAQIAYAESFLAVKYLLDNYGKESFYILLDTLRTSRSMERAMNAAIGGSAEEFEKEFFDYLEKRYNVMSLFADLYFLWIFLAVVVFVGALTKFLKRKKYYEKWEDEDRLQSRDYDYGDPDNPEQIDDEDQPWN